MADEMKVNAELQADAAGGDSSAAPKDISGKLEAAASNIHRAHADARARRSEQERNSKKTESEAKARLEETEKRHIESERAAAVTAEQRRAALEYAELYRQKLLKEQRKAQAAARQKAREERAAAEAAAREAKLAELAAAREKENAEARARSEMASALLGKMESRVKAAEADAVAEPEAVESVVAEPIAEQTPVVEEAPAMEAAPVVEEAPGVEQAPAVEAPIVTAPAEPVAAADESDTISFTVDGSTSVAEERDAAAAAAVESFMAGGLVVSDEGGVITIETEEGMRVDVTAADDPAVAPPTISPNAFYLRQINEANARHQMALNHMRMTTGYARETAARMLADQEARYNKEMDALREKHRLVEEAYNQQMAMMENARATAESIMNAATERAAEVERSATPEEMLTRQTVVEAVAEALAASRAAEQTPAPVAEEPVVEEPVAEQAPAEQLVRHAPVRMNDPEVVAMIQLGATLKNRKQLKKYLKKSGKLAEKRDADINSVLEAQGAPIKARLIAEQKAEIKKTRNRAVKKEAKAELKLLKKRPAADFVSEPSVNSTVSMIRVGGALLELRCDNLTQVARLANLKKKRQRKQLDRYTDYLFADIERYNDFTDFFEEATGEFLHKINLSLPGVLAEGRGRAVIPAIIYRQRLDERVMGKAPSSSPDSYIYTIPTSDAPDETGFSVTKIQGTKENTVTVVDYKRAAVMAKYMLGNISVDGDASFKMFRKSLKKALKVFNKQFKALAKREKKLAKLERKAKKKKRPFNAQMQIRAITEARYLLRRELLIIDYIKFIKALDYGRSEFIAAYKRELVKAIAEYNDMLVSYSPIIGIEFTAIESKTVDEVMRSREIPEIPTLATLYELFETVGENTRIVGEHKPRLRARYTIAFGGEAVGDDDDQPIDPFEGTAPTPTSGAPATPELFSVVNASSKLPVRRKRDRHGDWVTVVNSSSKLPPKPAVIIAAATPAPVAQPAAELVDIEIYESADRAEADDDAELAGMSAGEVRKYLVESEKKIQNAKKKLYRFESLARANLGREKAIAIVNCLVVQKAIIDELSDNMIANRDAGRLNAAKNIKKRMLIEISRYNRYVRDYKVVTGESLTEAQRSIPDDILSRGAYQILPVLSFDAPDQADDSEIKGQAVESHATNNSNDRNVYVMNKKQLKKFLKTTDKEVIKLRGALKKKQTKKSAAKGEKRAALLVDCITIEKSIVDQLIAALTACCQVQSKKDIAPARRALATEINAYNRCITEYIKLTGKELSLASTSIPSDIVSGNAYEPLKSTSYTMAMPGEVRAAAMAEMDELAAESAAEQERAAYVDSAALTARTQAQANKDIVLLTQQADFEISMLESERDISKCRYGHGYDNGKKTRRKIAKKIAAIKKNHKAALKCESADNKRYYAVVTNNPDTMKAPKPKLDRAKIASLRARMIALLNERDLINSKLAAIYTGKEYNPDGTSINQTWRAVKTAAAFRMQKKQKGLAKTVKKLRCGEGERGRIYGLMNKRVDAASTVALCKYRLAKEDLTRNEKNLLKQDISKNKKLDKLTEKDIKWMIKKARKRHLHASKAFEWMFGAGLVLAIVIAAIVVFFAFFGGDMLDSVKGLLGM